MTLYNYAVLKKNNDYLAVFNNSNTYYWDLGHYYDQGYTFLMYVSAFNANSAIEIAKQNVNSELGRLKAELATLRQKYENLQNINNSFGFSTQTNNFNPLDVLGFKTKPDKTELKKRYKSLSQKFHPDKGGSDLLMKMIKDAYDNLNREFT